MIRVVETGRNPTMRYIGRTHGVSVAWLHETFKGEDLNLAYELTSRMCADIYTKAFTDADKWRLACWLINICDPKELKELAKRSSERDEPPPQSGGGDQPGHKSCPENGGYHQNFRSRKRQRETWWGPREPSPTGGHKHHNGWKR